MVNKDEGGRGLVSPPPPTAYLAMLPEATSLISPFRSTKSMKIPLEILMCVAELAPPHLTPLAPPTTLRVIQLLNINSVWQQTAGFETDSGFLQRGVFFLVFFFQMQAVHLTGAAFTVFFGAVNVSCIH